MEGPLPYTSTRTKPRGLLSSTMIWTPWTFAPSESRVQTVLSQVSHGRVRPRGGTPLGWSLGGASPVLGTGSGPHSRGTSLGDPPGVCPRRGLACRILAWAVSLLASPLLESPGLDCRCRLRLESQSPHSSVLRFSCGIPWSHSARIPTPLVESCWRAHPRTLRVGDRGVSYSPSRILMDP